MFCFDNIFSLILYFHFWNQPNKTSISSFIDTYFFVLYVKLHAHFKLNDGKKELVRSTPFVSLEEGQRGSILFLGKKSSCSKWRTKLFCILSKKNCGEKVLTRSKKETLPQNLKDPLLREVRGCFLTKRYQYIFSIQLKSLRPINETCYRSITFKLLKIDLKGLTWWISREQDTCVEFVNS